MEQATDAAFRSPNHLINESSPYLLSHAHNPVEWYPWGNEALDKARQLDRPIFLSIGYAACHWCHVMERESFEDPATAEILNNHYVSIKVDREQRPDLDHIYMIFTQAMTGAGGWPMSVFLTPDLKPFFAGTYFPPDDRYGRPSFSHVLTEIAKAWAEARDTIVESSESIFEELGKHLNRSHGETVLSDRLISAGAEQLMQNFDHANGGFGTAPKFPHSTDLSLFLRVSRRFGDLTYSQAAEKSLIAMASGGIYDHVGGGFARYSTDAQWLVPHFEKMLYDNALLVPVYLEVYQISGNDIYRTVAEETLDFVLREMTHPGGGFYSALDADSEGHEGLFYVWTKAELEQVLGEDAEFAIRYFNVTEQGNFEGRSILFVNEHSHRFREQLPANEFSLLLTRVKEKLLAARSTRVRPATDDKILVSWNGLMLSAFARGYQVIGHERYREAAVHCAEFISKELCRDHRLVHTWRNGVTTEGEFLEDYGYFVRGLLELYESDPSDNNIRWALLARQLADRAIELFFDKADGSFYLRPADQADLIFRPKEENDGALPSAGSFLIHALLKLHRLTDDENYYRVAEQGLKALSGQMEKYPVVMAAALLALDYFKSDKVEVVIVGKGPERDRALQYLFRRYEPNRLIAVSATGLDGFPIFKGRELTDGQLQIYVCRNSVCAIPAATLDELKERLAAVV